jgi:hypothetical protein
MFQSVAAWRLDGLLAASQEHAWYYCSPRAGVCRFTHVGKFLWGSPGDHTGGQPAVDFLSRQAFLGTVLRAPSIVPVADYRLSGPLKYVVFPRRSLRPVVSAPRNWQPLGRYPNRQPRESNQGGRLLSELLLVLKSIHDLGFVHGQIDARHIQLDPHGRLVLTGLGRCFPIDAANACHPHPAAFLNRAGVPGQMVTAEDIRQVGEWLIHLFGETIRNSPVVRAMLAEAPEDRPTADQLLELLRFRHAA